MGDPIWLAGMVECEHGFDAAFLPDPIPAGFSWCMVYAGGSSALHPYPDADVDRARAAGLAVLPVWVPTVGVDDPVAAAGQFIEWLNRHGVPDDTAVLADMETSTGAVAAEWLNRFADVLSGRPFKDVNLTYGSSGTVYGLPARSGYVVADWTGQPHLFLRPESPACQYAAGITTSTGAIAIDPSRTATRVRAASPGQIDLDVAARPLVRRMWQPA